MAPKGPPRPTAQPPQSLDELAEVAARLAQEPHPNEWYRAYNPPFRVAEQPLHTLRPLRLLIVGAGAAGLLAVYQAGRQLRDVTVACYEKNADVGGAWLENRYPGLEIDSPSHCYQWSFHPNPGWSKYMAPGREVWAYLKDWAVGAGLMKDVKLRHRVEGAVWNEEEAVWEIHGTTDDGRPFSDRGDFLFACNGALNTPKWLDVPGIDKFKGQLVHSGMWPDDIELAGKTVAVIGANGASGVQLAPAIQPVVGKLVIYLRSPGWAVSGVRSKHTGKDRRNFEYTPEQIRRFREDPELLDRYDRDVEADLNWVYEGVHLGGDLHTKLMGFLRTGTLQSFGPAAEGFLPDYGFGCRRSAPVQDFAERMRQPNVDIVRAAVVGFTETGVVDADGGTRDVDVCVCATSFEAGMPSFPITGRGGQDLGAELAAHGKSYLGVMVHGFPNLIYNSATSAPANHGAYLPILEWYTRYAFQLVAHAQRTSIRTLSPSAAAQDDFFEWTHQLMKRLTLSQPCHSWFKRGLAHGPAVMCYAGSRTHFYELLATPRLEDFDATYAGEHGADGGKGGNRFAYLGSGFTRAETTPGASVVWYLDVLREEFARGRTVFDVNPLRPAPVPPDADAVIPKEAAAPKL